MVRFRTLGCYPLTGAIESDADTLPAIIREMLLTRLSERQGRVDRSRSIGVDGEEEGRRILLMTRAPEPLIAPNVDAFLLTQERKDLLRFITCGSVDDGKSTLIGRLLYESKMIFEDQLAALAADSQEVGTRGGELDFALLVDGLSAEREQGITIDVAYRFFSTEKRKFIVADTPGHEQYTRNMVTGASTADLAVILIDARKGVLTQTRRHSYLVSAPGHSPGRAGDQQDGPGRATREEVFARIETRLPRVRESTWASGTSPAFRCRAVHGDNVVAQRRTRCLGTGARR